jgi:hypothetical protein
VKRQVINITNNVKDDEESEQETIPDDVGSVPDPDTKPDPGSEAEN